MRALLLEYDTDGDDLSVLWYTLVHHCATANCHYFRERELDTVNGKVLLTEEQEEARLTGLRILARMIVRAHLASLGEGIDSAVGDEGREIEDLTSKNGRPIPPILKARDTSGP